MTTDRTTGAFPARQRLAQTRAEIIGAILPDAVAEHPTEPSRDRAWAAAAETDRLAATRAAAMAERSAAQRAAQREAVAAWMADAPDVPDARQAADRAALGRGGGRRRAPPSPPPSSFGWVPPLLRRGASIWWRHHPAHAVVEVADSALSHVAQRRPYQMLGVAAGIGALLVLVRPWRLVSITGLALAAVRMTDVRSLVGSVIRNA